MQGEPYATVPLPTKTRGSRIQPGYPELLQGLYQPSPFFCPSHSQLPVQTSPSLFCLGRHSGEERKKGKSNSLHLAYFQTELDCFHARVIQVREDFESLFYKVRTINSQEAADLCVPTYNDRTPIKKSNLFWRRIPCYGDAFYSLYLLKGGLSCKTFQTPSLLELKPPYSLAATHQLQEEGGLLPGLCWWRAQQEWFSLCPSRHRKDTAPLTGWS